MKYLNTYLIFLVHFIIIFNAVKVQTFSKDYYVAAVVEYSTKYDKSKSIIINMEENTYEYLTLITEAKKKNADIIVFPESGLTTVSLPAVPEYLLSYTSVLPDPNELINPCDKEREGNENWPWANYVTDISCSAKLNKIYVVINLPERYSRDRNGDSWYIYNTNLVFNREGTIIAKYRKYNLSNEPGFDRTKEAELVTFETDFGVTFGTFICFDILFSHPAKMVAQMENVTDIVYPTAWFSELPFLTAVEIQAGWARAYGVNLLAANNNDPSIYRGGSGIFSATEILKYIIPVTKSTTLIVANVPKIKSKAHHSYVYSSNKNASIPDEFSSDALEIINENLSMYTTKLISEIEGENYELCHDKFCCNFTIRHTKKERSDYMYRIAAYEGIYYFGTDEGYIQACGLIACTGTKQSSCGAYNWQEEHPKQFKRIIIKGQFSEAQSTVLFPVTVTYGLHPLSYDAYIYNETTPTVIKTSRPVNKILGFGIYGVLSNSNSNAFNSGPLLPLTVSIIILWISYR